MNNIKVNNNQIGGEIIKDNETYVLRDNKTLRDLILSQTVLHRNQETRGHTHVGQEEVYFFVHGTGRIQVDMKTYEITSGDIVMIPDGVFHKVWNTGESDLVFNCVFNGKRNH